MLRLEIDRWALMRIRPQSMWKRMRYSPTGGFDNILPRAKVDWIETRVRQQGLDS
jgi:hypothetical protein